MKVLFVRSGNRGIDPISQAQGESLSKEKIIVEYFDIIGKGIFGYLRNVPLIKYKIKLYNPDIIHAHYSRSAYVATIASFFKKPIIASLMGSDVEAKSFERFIIKVFSKFLWKRVIVKSKSMRNKLNLSCVSIIPNGIDLEKFQYIPKIVAQQELGFLINKRNVIWISDPSRAEKNFRLAEEAFKYLNSEHIVLHVINNIKHNRIPLYYYAADCLLLTSLWEGSPNVIKESLACNCPIVSTDVGDVRENISDVEGCYITDSDPKDVADKVLKAINFQKPTKGREKIIKMGIDSDTIAKRIIEIYKEVL